MRADEVRRVLVVGAGTMGQQIGLQCAAHGLGVVLLDSDPAALERADAQLRGDLALRVERQWRAVDNARRQYLDMDGAHRA